MYVWQLLSRGVFILYIRLLNSKRSHACILKSVKKNDRSRFQRRVSFVRFNMVSWSLNDRKIYKEIRRSAHRYRTIILHVFSTTEVPSVDKTEEYLHSCVIFRYYQTWIHPLLTAYDNLLNRCDIFIVMETREGVSNFVEKGKCMGKGDPDRVSLLKDSWRDNGS